MPIGARIIQKPPSILHYLLGGVGQGITQGMDQITKEREKRDSVANRVIESVLQGQLPEELVGTPLFGDFAKSTGIDKNKGIQQLISRVKERQTEAYTLADYVAEQKEKVLVEEQRKIRQQLGTRYMEKEMDMYFTDLGTVTPEESIKRGKAAIEFAKEQGIDISSMNYKGIGFVTDYTRRKDELAGKEKKEKDWEGNTEKYNSFVIAGRNFRTASMKYLVGVKTGKLPADAAFMQIMKDMDITLQLPRLEKLSPDKRVAIMRKEFNKGIIAHNKKLRDAGRRSGLPMGEITRLKLIGTEKEDFKDIPVPENAAGNRANILLPGRGEKPEEDYLASIEILRGMGITTKGQLKLRRDIMSAALRNGFDIQKLLSYLE